MSQHWPLPERFRVRLTFESDWHVGSGMGRPGNIDRLVVRDADDLPFVPAKTLHGIWRDACERLCRGLDNGQNGAWSRLVDQLFGSQPALGSSDPTGRHGDPTAVPLRSAVQVRPARIPSPLRELLALSDRRVRQALSFVKPGVKIDRRSGSAQTDFLRFEELARKGTVLEADCHLTVRDRATRELASALLVASAKLVERLGGKRRRGTGRCRLEVLGADASAAVAWLEGTTSPPVWSVGEVNDSPSDTLHAADSTDPWLCVPLVLRLQGPLAVSHRTTGNVVETLDFVPGSYLLPHVTRTLSGLGLDVRSALQAGEICVLPAYPEVDGERSQPVPLAWFAPKGGKGLEEPEKVVNQLLQKLPEEPQHKQLREGYVSSRPTRTVKPPITVWTHNSVEDQAQRPTEATGGVYTYEAIAPTDHGTPVLLRSELRLRKSLADRLGQTDASWWERLNGEVALGRSKKDDYGCVRLEVAKPVPFTTDAAIRSDQLLFVWLVSDVLLRNSRLRPEPTAACLGEELSRRLGVTLKLRESTHGQLDELVRIRRLDTWHVGWGLPRPSLVALQAGSCMVFQVVDGTLDPAKLAAVEAGGIGERTAEGYGQVRFNHRLLTESLTASSSERDLPDGKTKPRMTMNPISPHDPSYAFARLIETECWKHEIRRTCLGIAAEAKKRKEYLGWEATKDFPPMSQLGGLRGQLMLMQKTDQRKQVLDWLQHLDQNKRRREKWPSIPKVRAFIESDSRIWDIIRTDDWPVLTTSAREELKRELWALAVRNFFDACIRAHKRELEVVRGA